MFRDNFASFERDVAPSIQAAAPRA
jgi:hypothetical protein